MNVYDIKFADGTVKQFGSRRGVGTIADQIRMAAPTVIAWRRRNTTEWRSVK